MKARDEAGQDEDWEVQQKKATSSLPTESEEMSAATFLAAVKTRLTEWGKVDEYQNFILAISGGIDVKAALKVLRGHDDLVEVFQHKFAPQADIAAVLAGIKREDSDEPRPPPAPPPRGVVKTETGAPRAAQKGAPRCPVDTPRHSLVKSELGVKSEHSGAMPRPPSFAPGTKMNLTIGDDSDDDVEFHEVASVAAAVRKGKAACIAELAKIIFAKERTGHEGTRQRLAMVHYATKVAAKPRFPRELFILRGVPGIGKSEYAMQQLQEYLAYDADEEVAARLTHVCAIDDFFEHFKGNEPEYKFDVKKLEAAHEKNAARSQLAMEAGIHPLYIDAANLRLWEMRAYVELADRLGYVTTIVEPGEICEKAEDINYLTTANDTSGRGAAGKVVLRGQLVAMLKASERLEDAEDPLDSIRNKKRPAGTRTIEPAPTPPPGIPRPAPAGKVGGKGSSGGPVSRGGLGGALGARRPPYVPAQFGGRPRPY